MTVQKDVTKNIYVGNGSTRTFPFTFECPAEHPEYIKVYLMQDDGTALATSDYQLDMDAKQITYPSSGTALPEGKKLVIMRELPLQQMMNLVNNGPYFAEDVETAFDENVMAMQQIAEKLNRSIIMSVDIDGDAFVNEVPFEAGKSFRIADDGKSIVLTEDPGKVIDEAKGLAEETATNAQEAKQAAAEIKTIYNSGGLTPITDLAGSIGTAIKRWGYIFANKVFAMNLPIVYKSVAEMKADSLLSAGMTACTLGYYSPNDGGAGTYIIRAKADGDVDDGGSLHELVSGLIAELVAENGTVNVKQFGAHGDGVTDDSDAFIRCCNKVTGLYIPKGSYKLSSPVDISNISCLEGDGIDTVICGVLNSTSNQGYRIIKNLKFASLNDSRAEAGLKGIFTLATFENITFIGCKIAMDFTYGTWINVFRNISIQYCDIGINAPDQFNAIAFQGCIQHCTIAIKLNNQARQLNFYDCDFEMNDTVFVLKDAMALNLKNTYIEYNNKIFDFAALETAFFNSDIIVNNCYIYNDAENITDGWLVTMPSHSDSQLDVKATTLKLSNNNINIVNTSEFPKPFLITGNYTSSYLAISLENNVYRFNASVFPVTTYFDLFKMENGKEYSAYPLSIASDFPYYKYSNLYWYSSSALNKEDQRFSRKFHMLGYIELQKTGSEFLSLDMQETLFPYQPTFRGMCDLVYSDGSVDRVYFKTDSHNIHIYNADANKTTSKIVFDVTYYC